MKRTRLFIAPLSLCMLFLSGCASYQAAPLNTVRSVFKKNPEMDANVYVSAKAFDKHDCKKYLDRDVISKGYRPIQVTIENYSDEDYSFSTDGINLRCVRPEEVANRVHTSTMGRALGYGIPGLMLLWPLLIPAVVDGVKSSAANVALDADFCAKTATDQTIQPHSCFNKLIFVPSEDYRSSLTVSLMNQTSNKIESYDVAVN